MSVWARVYGWWFNNWPGIILSAAATMLLAAVLVVSVMATARTPSIHYYAQTTATPAGDVPCIIATRTGSDAIAMSCGWGAP